MQPYLKWPVWKKFWNQRGQPRNGCDGIDWWQNFNNINSGQFVLPHPSFTKLTWIVVIKIFQSTYTITAISWLPPLISQLFHTGHFKYAAIFLQPGCFWVGITSFCSTFTGFMTMADVHRLGVPNMAELLTGSADLCTGDLECSWIFYRL